MQKQSPHLASGSSSDLKYLKYHTRIVASNTAKRQQVVMQHRFGEQHPGGFVSFLAILSMSFKCSYILLKVFLFVA
jgi:hypothetical protein